MKYILSIIVFLISATLLLPAQKPEPVAWSYHFPLDIIPVVSGSFGEIRSNHFHSGLDLATLGKTGLPVYAADQGYVSRIRVSPFGFGKAIYIDHPSGYTTVYAHLERFNALFDSLVLTMQYRGESFSVQYYPEPGTFPVKRGEVIAFSGNSGSSGGPHLHFEVRQTKEERPIDPLFFSNPVKDDVRPQIIGVKLYPLSPGATINGKNQPQYFPAVFYNGRFHLKSNPRITASGTIGAGIEVLDYYTGSWRKCGVHSISLKADDQEAFYFGMDGFLFGDTRYLNSHIDYHEKVTSGKTIQKSFLDPFNRLNLYRTNGQKGKITVIPGRGINLDYEIEDVSGNSSQLSFKVQGVAQGQPAGGSVQESAEPIIRAGRSFAYRHDGIEVSFTDDCFYDDVFGEIEMLNSVPLFLSKAVKVLDETTPMHTFFELKIPIPESQETKDLIGARMTQSGKLVSAGGHISGTRFVINAREGGIYGLTRDTVPPEVRILNKPAGLNYRGRSSLRLKMKDDFSGIDSYRGTIDGKWALFEYDAKNHRLECFFDKVPSLSRGEHRVKILVIDGVGNEKLIEEVFRY